MIFFGQGIHCGPVRSHVSHAIDQWTSDTGLGIRNGAVDHLVMCYIFFYIYNNQRGILK